MNRATILAVCSIAAYFSACAPPPEPLACAELTTWGGETVEVTSAQEVSGHCEVSGTIDGEIGFELLLPAEWNAKLVMAGGGGFVGSTDNALQERPLPGVATPLEKGYATVSTDTGHQGSMVDASWALNAPEREENFAHRAVHRTAETAKAAVEAYYGKPSNYSYFFGCSRGGSQALVSAERYPNDFDGIISGAPAIDWPGLGALGIQIQQRVFPDAARSDAPVVTEDNLALLSRAILSACDASDGVGDGLIESPASCDFDPATLPRCVSDQPQSDCLTSDQLEAIQAVYEGVPGAPGYPFGAEADPAGWRAWITGSYFPGAGPSLQYVLATQIFKYLVFDDPEWDYRSYDLSHWKQDTRAAAELLNATDPDLAAFRDRGAKLILWHGWSDVAIPAAHTIDYYDSVEGGDPSVRDYARLFLMPGVTHCAGGPGPDSVDWLDVLEGWVERGEAPERIVANKYDDTGNVTMSRPLCLYPRVARWDGTGDTNDAASFACVEPDAASAPASD